MPGYKYHQNDGLALRRMKIARDIQASNCQSQCTLDIKCKRRFCVRKYGAQLEVPAPARPS